MRDIIAGVLAAIGIMMVFVGLLVMITGSIKGLELAIGGGITICAALITGGHIKP